MNNLEAKVKLCYGCESLFIDLKTTEGKISRQFNCKMVPMTEDSECPCIKCLVKMRCIIDDSECEPFTKYRRSLPIKDLF